MFSYEKQTGNTIRYGEELVEEAYSGEEIAVSTARVQKEVLGNPAPQRPKANIEEDI